MKSGLGRGFESLIPTEVFDDEFDLTAQEDKKGSELKELPIEEVIRDEEQPRQEFSPEAIGALANSIKEHGVLQPIVVTREGEKYKIVAGERRWRAAKAAGLDTIPAIVRSMDLQKRLEIAIVENAQREDLNAIELATAYAKLKAQFNLTNKDIADKIGKSESSVMSTLRLLSLPDDVKKTMVKEKLSEGVMRPLIAADPLMIEKVLPKIIKEGWSVRKVEKYVAENKKKSSTAAVKKIEHYKEEDILENKYGVTVKISGRSVTFKCGSDKELKELLAKF